MDLILIPATYDDQAADARPDRLAGVAFLGGFPVGVPEAVVTGLVRLRDQRRFDVPATLVCPEFGPDDARESIDAGEHPELAGARLSLVDLDAGHWPMFSCPGRLASVLADAATAGPR